jgi:large subunit ribosomal protein L3
MKAALIGKKIGMTGLFTETGKYIPCTVVQAGPCTVIQVKTIENDGYFAYQLGWGERSEKRINKPELGHYKKHNLKANECLCEFRDLEKSYVIGDTLTVDQFIKGDKIHVSGKSKGRGFQGVVKRHHFGGVGMSTHGQSDRQRHPGSIGSSSYPSRVFKGLRMAGRMGGTRITTRNLEVVDIIPEKNLLLIKGSIPGAPNSIIEIIKQ